MTKVCKFLAGAFVALALAQFAAAQIVYNVTDLGTLGCPFSQAQAVNNFGKAAGFAQTASSSCIYTHAVSWTHSGIKDLGTLGGNTSIAQGVSDFGVIVGGADTGDSNDSTHAFLYITKMFDLGTLGGFNSQANAINNFFQIVGYSTTSGEVSTHAFSWQPFNNGLTDLGTLTGDPSENSQAWANNKFGNIAGSSDDALKGTTDAVLWDIKGIHDLGTLPGGTVAQANGINAHRHVVGFSDTAAGETHAFWFSRSMHDLGTLGGTFSVANAIATNDPNDHDEFEEDNDDADLVVGSSNITDDADQHAFLWTSKSGMVDLNNLISSASGWDLQSASSVNHRAQIVGAGTINGEVHGFLLTRISDE